MNLSRTLSRNQIFFLKQVCSGESVIEYIPEFGYYAEKYKMRDGTVLLGYAAGRSKPLKRTLIKKRLFGGGHFANAIMDLFQRGILIDVNGRLMPNPEARKQFGSPPPTAAPKRVVKMSRTRAARVQDHHLPQM